MFVEEEYIMRREGYTESPDVSGPTDCHEKCWPHLALCLCSLRCAASACVQCYLPSIDSPYVSGRYSETQKRCLYVSLYIFRIRTLVQILIA